MKLSFFECLEFEIDWKAVAAIALGTAICSIF